MTRSGHYGRQEAAAIIRILETDVHLKLYSDDHSLSGEGNPASEGGTYAGMQM